MAETKKYICKTNILGDQLYLEGEEIELDAKSAKRLLAEKKIIIVKDEVPKGGDDADGKNGAVGGEGQKGNKDESLKDKTKGTTKGGKK